MIRENIRTFLSVIRRKRGIISSGGTSYRCGQSGWIRLALRFAGRRVRVLISCPAKERCLNASPQTPILQERLLSGTTSTNATLPGGTPRPLSSGSLRSCCSRLRFNRDPFTEFSGALSQHCCVAEADTDAVLRLWAGLGYYAGQESAEINPDYRQANSAEDFRELNGR